MHFGRSRSSGLYHRLNIPQQEAIYLIHLSDVVHDPRNHPRTFSTTRLSSYKDETSPLPVVSPAPVATVHPSQRRRDITGEITGCENVKQDDDAARAVVRSMWNDHTGQRRSGKRSDATLIEWPSINDVKWGCMTLFQGACRGWT